MAMKILSIDGGGIRGILPGLVMVALEEKLQNKSGNPDARIADYFDLVAGTSTGAILGAAYLCPGENGRPKFTAQEAVDLYLQKGHKIFDVGLWRKIIAVGGYNDEKYPAKEIERVLREAFGDTKLSQLLKPTCFVSYDVYKRRPIIFTQHDAEKEDKDILVRDLLRGSSAAPTYFEAIKVSTISEKPITYTLVDGGMVANDPAMCAYSESFKLGEVQGFKETRIFSVGTGRNLRKYTFDEIKDWGKIGWAKPAIDIALEGGPQMNDYHLELVSPTIPGLKYQKIKPELKYGPSEEEEVSPDLDNASEDNLRKLKEAGIKCAKGHDEELEEFADFLIKDQS